MPLTAIPTARILTIADAVVAAINTLDLPSIQVGAAAVRGYSFGFTDSELNMLRVVVRPEDYANAEQTAVAVNQSYKIQVGVLRRVPKRTTVQTDPAMNLTIAIARLFNLGRELTVGSDVLLVTSQLFIPLFLHDATTMDDPDSSTVRFDSRMDVEFTELGRPLSSAT